MKRSGAKPGRLTGGHLQEHSSNGTSASQDGTGLLGNGGTSELVWAGVDWGTCAVWNIGGGSVDGVDRGGGGDWVDWLDWNRRSGDCDGASLSICGAVRDGGSSTGNNWLGWGAAALGSSIGWVVRLLLNWADGGRGVHGSDNLAALEVGGGRVDGAGCVLWVVWGGRGGARQNWLGGGAVDGAGAGAARWIVLIVRRRGGGGGGGRRRHWPPIRFGSNNGGGSSAGEDNWSEAHLE